MIQTREPKSSAGLLSYMMGGVAPAAEWKPIMASPSAEVWWLGSKNEHPQEEAKLSCMTALEDTQHHLLPDSVGRSTNPTSR